VREEDRQGEGMHDRRQRDIGVGRQHRAQGDRAMRRQILDQLIGEARGVVRSTHR